MRKLFVLIAFAALLAGCGDGKDDTPPAAATPAPTEVEAASTTSTATREGVKDYYGAVHDQQRRRRSDAAIEAEYHQPPKPAEAGLGEPITLTGDEHRRAARGDRDQGRHRTAGRAPQARQRPASHAASTTARDRRTTAPVADARRSTSRRVLRPVPEGDASRRASLALEQVPAEAGDLEPG